jgi:hypothetical protein
MKTIKSLILTLALAGAAYAGEMPQPAPPPSSATIAGDIPQPLAPSSTTSAPQTTENTLTELVIVIAENLLRLY